MATFEFDGAEYELLVEIDDWLMAETSAVCKMCGLKGIGEIGEAVQALDPGVLTAIAVISIKRGGGAATYTAVSEGVRLGPLFKALTDYIEAAQAKADEAKEGDESPDPTPAVIETA